MSKPTKVNFGQNIVYMNGEPLRLGGTYGCDQRTVAVFVQEIINKSELPTESVIKINKRMDEVLGKPLTLSETVVTALHGIYEDEKVLVGSERQRRMDYARKCNRLGMVKISEADIKYLMPLIEKYYRGALVSPQVEVLLKGEQFLLVEEEEDEDDEDLEVSTPEPAPTTDKGTET